MEYYVKKMSVQRIIYSLQCLELFYVCRPLSTIASFPLDGSAKRRLEMFYSNYVKSRRQNQAIELPELGIS